MHGAPAHIKFDGRDYILSPLTLGDLEEFEAWAKRRRHDDADDHIARLKKHEASSPEKCAAIVDAAVADCASGMAEARAARSAAGMGLMLHLSLRQRQPEVTLEQAKRIVKFAGHERIEALIDEITFGPSEGDADKPNPPAAAATANPTAAGPTGASSSSAN